VRGAVLEHGKYQGVGRWFIPAPPNEMEDILPVGEVNTAPLDMFRIIC